MCYKFCQHELEIFHIRKVITDSIGIKISVFPKSAPVPLGKLKKKKKKRKPIKGTFNLPLVVNLITINFYIYIFILRENKNLA